jgi:hypothetical protein
MMLPSICMQSFAVEHGAPSGTCPAKIDWHVDRADDRLPGTGWQLWPCAACTSAMQFVASVMLYSPVAVGP